MNPKNSRELKRTQGNSRELKATWDSSREALVDVKEGKKLRKRGKEVKFQKSENKRKHRSAQQALKNIFYPFSTLFPGHLVYLDISQKKYTHLDQEDKCSHQTFVQQWMPYLLKANFSEAPKKCANNFYLEREDFPLCGWGDGQNKTI